MKTYTFQSPAGNWELDFPNDEMAVYHGRVNNAHKVICFNVVLAEIVDIGYGFKVFKSYIQSMNSKQCPDCD